MSSYKAPLNDIRFALFDVIGADAQFARLGFDEASRDVIDAILEEAARFTETVLAPLNAVGDREGCKLDQATAEVTVPTGFKPAFDQFVEGGWTGLTSPVEFGGQAMPQTLGFPLKEACAQFCK